MNLQPENDLAIADLRFLLPLIAGNRVVLNGSYNLLEMELHQFGVSFSHLDDLQREPPQEAQYDGALIPMLHLDKLDITMRCIQNCLKEGSWVVWGIKNSDYWLKSIKPDRHPHILNLNIKQASDYFSKFGFSIIKQFGNADRIINPRYLVDLQTSQPTRYFIENVQIPYTRKGAFKQVISRYWIRAFQYNSLYPSLIILTRFTNPGSGISK